MLDDLATAGRVLTGSFEQRERQVGMLSPELHTSLLNMIALFCRQEDDRNGGPFEHGAAVVARALRLPEVSLGHYL